MEKKKINRIKKNLKKYIKSFIEIVSFLFIFMFYGYIGNFGFKYISHILFSKEGFSRGMVLLSIFVVAAFIFVVWITVKFLLNLFKTTKKLSKNKYLLSAITFIIIILIFGISMIRDLYISPYPLVFNIPETEYTFQTYIECHSQKGLHYILIEDTFKCDTTIKSKKEGFMNLTSGYDIKIGKYYALMKEWNITNIWLENFNQTEDFSKLNGMYVPITNEEFTLFQFMISFVYNNTLPINLDSYSIWIKPITYEEYAKKLNERVSLLLLLFSLAIFSVLSGVRNLKNIIENK